MRNSILLITLAISSILFSAKAQNIEFEKLTFKTPFEEHIFKNHNSSSALELLLAISPDMDTARYNQIKQSIIDFEDNLRYKKFETKKESKKVKTLFDETHSLFLGKYEDIVNFGDVFTLKTFNCVSGTALYALVLEDFNIPYVIKESPTHVYIVVNPDESHIVLESTRPDIGFIDKSDHYIKNIIEQLIELKQISKSEVNSKGYRKTYNDYFFSEDVITLKALASIQYSNEAIELIDKENLEDALNAIYKAQYLNESPSNLYIITNILSQFISENDLNDSTDFSKIVEYSNIVKANEEYIEALHAQKCYSLIIEEGNLEPAKNMTDYFVSNLTDSNLRESIELNYIIQLADYYQAKGDWEQSIHYAERAYRVNPNNVKLHRLISISINNKNVGKSFSQDLLDELIEYKEQFAFLKDHTMINNMTSNTSTYLAVNFLMNREITKSLNAIKIFEELVEEHKDKISFREPMIAGYYIQLCEYYFQINKYSKGCQAIKSGLKILPNNENLLKKKNVLVRAGYY